MEILKIVVGMSRTNCYIAYNESKNAVIIDPGDDSKSIIDTVKSNNLNIKYIFLTHGHFDHIMALGDVKKEFNDAKVVILKKGADFLEDDTLNLYTRFVGGNREITKADIELENNESIKMDNDTFTFVNTPGHTDGSSIIISGDIIFSGDTLFYDTIGRIDHPTGDMKKTMETIEYFKSLENDYRVLPGHGGETTLNREKKCNYYFTGDM